MKPLCAAISEPEYVSDRAVTVSPRAMMELPGVARYEALLDILFHSSVWVLTSHSVDSEGALVGQSVGALNGESEVDDAVGISVTQVSAEVAPTTALAESAGQSTHGR